MVSSLKIFDVSKSGKMTELIQTKHRFGILVEFSFNIAYRMVFENSTGNTIHTLSMMKKFEQFIENNTGLVRR